jgi:uncharacterized damage-inducible protein DinB
MFQRCQQNSFKKRLYLPPLRGPAKSDAAGEQMRAVSRLRNMLIAIRQRRFTLLSLRRSILISPSFAGVCMADIGALYLDEAFRSLRGHKRLADTAIAQLSDEEFFAAPDAESNSVAIIVKHMAGNMRSRFSDFLTTDGEKPDRNRDQEFVSGNATRAEVLAIWEKHWALVFDTLNGLSADDLAREVTIRHEPHSVLQAINRQIAHYSYHVGQIVFLAKHWKGTSWKTLSIARGQSEAANAAMAAKHKSG